MPTYATGKTFHESDGKSIIVTLTSTVDTGQVAFVQGWLGITAKSGQYGEHVALTIDEREYQLKVPSTLAVTKGQTIFVDVTDLTGHTPADSSYFTAAGANREKLMRATRDKTADHVVTGILLAGRT